GGGGLLRRREQGLQPRRERRAGFARGTRGREGRRRRAALRRQGGQWHRRHAPPPVTREHRAKEPARRAARQPHRRAGNRTDRAPLRQAGSREVANRRSGTVPPRGAVARATTATGSSRSPQFRLAVAACASFSFVAHSSQHTSTVLPPTVTLIAFSSSL